MYHEPLNTIKESIMVYPAGGQIGVSVKIEDLIRGNRQPGICVTRTLLGCFFAHSTCWLFALGGL